MITLTATWTDRGVQRQWTNQCAIAPEAIPVFARDLDELVGIAFETMWKELVRVKTLEAARAQEPRTFPVRMESGVKGVAFVPYAMIERHARRIMVSFGMSVAEMALRGGLSYVEICEVLEDWPRGCLATNEEDAREAVRQAVRLFREIEGPGSHLRVVP